MAEKIKTSSGTSLPNTKPALTERRFVFPFILITGLFFLWAFGVNLNDILIPHFKRAFGLTDFQSSFIQVAFFGGYFLAAFPAGKLMERIGYKRGLLTGLLLCVCGALLFLPASTAGIYGYFLVALFIMACGQSFLEVGANPYVTVLGPPETAALRINFAQSFNAVGAFVAPLLGRALILSSIELPPEQIAAMGASQLAAYRQAVASSARGPYLIIAGVFLAMIAAIYFTNLPEVSEGVGADSVTPSEQKGGARGLLAHGHLVKGVIAQFFYVGAQVGVASFVIRFAEQLEPSLTNKAASSYLLYHVLGFMIGRFGGSAVMKAVPPARLLAIFAGGSIVCAAIALTATGFVPIFAVVLIGFFHSIMFPTIFALSIAKLGPLTKRGSSFLVMAIIGGAVFPAIMGKISDASSIQKAFIVPLLCYLYILYFAISGYKPSADSAARTTALGVEGA
jgi:MFS transporter, FHS family, L-fucose permease